MNFLSIFREESREETIRLGVVTVFSGIVNGILIAVIINSARDAAPDKLNFRDLLLFLLCLVALILSRQYSLTRTAMLAERVIRKIRLRIIDKIRHTNLASYENLGKSPIYSALTQSTFTLSSSAPALASAFSSAIMLVFATGYIAYLSVTAFRLTLGFLAVGTAFFFWVHKRAELVMRESTANENRFFDLLHHHLDGFKETKMHRARNQDLYANHTVTVATEGERVKVRTHAELIRLNTFGTTFSYALIAVIIFIIPSWSPEDIVKTPQITAAILFILGPVTEMIGSVSQFFRCNDAVHHIREIERRLDSMAVNGANGVNGASPATPTPDLAGFQSLACEEVTFRYKSPQGGNDSFGIGPISLNVRPGEILFIVGGNGSGKSTFLKLLTGLYAPATGLIRLDGRVITEETLADYRSLFSPVFTDFHLFDRLYGLGGVDPALTQELLNQTDLADKTGVVDGRFTNLNLSTGQKKRLALTVALLEQRPILVFDELAADQDPLFRKQLYETRFKEWQRAGKTIIAVTHDDAYFHVADRVIKLEYGRIASGQTWG